MQEGPQQGVKRVRIDDPQTGTGSIQIAIEGNRITDRRPVPEQSPLGAVRIEQVRQVAQPLPLLLVAARELARVNALARPLDLDVPDDRSSDLDRVVGAHPKVG